MIENYENKKVKLNYDLLDHKKGDVITLKCIDGVPVARFWRDRYFDSKIDNCIEFMEQRKAKGYETKVIEPKNNKKRGGDK